MIPINKVKELISKHSVLEKELSSSEIDKKKFAEKSKDYSDLNEIIKEVKEYYSFEKEWVMTINIVAGANEFYITENHQ